MGVETGFEGKFLAAVQAGTVLAQVNTANGLCYSMRLLPGESADSFVARVVDCAKRYGGNRHWHSTECYNRSAEAEMDGRRWLCICGGPVPWEETVTYWFPE